MYQIIWPIWVNGPFYCDFRSAMRLLAMIKILEFLSLASRTSCKEENQSWNNLVDCIWSYNYLKNNNRTNLVFSKVTKSNHTGILTRDNGNQFAFQVRGLKFEDRFGSRKLVGILLVRFRNRRKYGNIYLNL